MEARREEESRTWEDHQRDWVQHSKNTSTTTSTTSTNKNNNKNNNNSDTNNIISNKQHQHSPAVEANTRSSMKSILKSPQSQHRYDDTTDTNNTACTTSCNTHYIVIGTKMNQHHRNWNRFVIIIIKWNSNSLSFGITTWHKVITLAAVMGLQLDLTGTTTKLASFLSTNMNNNIINIINIHIKTSSIAADPCPCNPLHRQNTTRKHHSKKECIWMPSIEETYSDAWVLLKMECTELSRKWERYRKDLIGVNRCWGCGSTLVSKEMDWVWMGPCIKWKRSRMKLKVCFLSSTFKEAEWYNRI